jgi:hypothetical protein
MLGRYLQKRLKFKGPVKLSQKEKRNQGVVRSMQIVEGELERRREGEEKRKKTKERKKKKERKMELAS